MNARTLYTLNLTIVSAVLFGTSTGRSAITNLLQYSFNTGDQLVFNAGDLPATLALTNKTGQPAVLLTPSAGGVSGLAGDRALDNSSADGMGNFDTYGGHASGGLPKSVNLDSLTLAGWFKTAGTAPVGTFARLIHFNYSGFQLYCFPEQCLSLSVGLQGGNSDSKFSDAVYGTTQQWVFFAATYDGTLASDNTHFYVGSRTSPVASAGVRTIRQYQPYISTVRLLANEDHQQPFHGLMDNVRVFIGGGSEGVLNLAALEALRLADLNPPPPSPANPVLEALPPSAGNYQFRWPSENGAAYTIQKSINLLSWSDDAMAHGTGLFLTNNRPISSDPAACFRIGIAR